MPPIHPNYDCPECGEPGLVDCSTNFERRWSCNWCDADFVDDEIKEITGMP